MCKYVKEVLPMQKRRMALLLLAVLSAAALIIGCGSSSTEPVIPATGLVVSASTPTVGLATCATCHTATVDDWLTTNHANLSTPGDLYSVGSPTIGQIGTCSKNCHDPNGDSSSLTAGYTGAAGIKRPVIGCESCHGPGSLHVSKGGQGPISVLSNTSGPVSWGSGTVQVSGQFLMCTSCHELLDSSGTATTTAVHDPAGTDAASASGDQFVITDTHFATTGDWTGIGTANKKSITGYSMSYRDAQGNYKTDYSDERVCVNCHNPHKPPTQNREWAQSAHADRNPFNLNSTKTGYFSGAWAHYNWSLSSRMACQRCHTTTGFAAYADALRTGDTARAQMLSAGTNTLAAVVASSAQFKPEMLKCNGCHTDNRGSLRNPGTITATYDLVSSGKTYAKASHTYPDLQGSNVCMACHTGRESGDTISGLNDPALLSAGTISFYDFSNNGFINSHYLTAGGQVFTVTGYRFPGRPYNNIPEYRHDKIGTSATLLLSPYVNTGSNGPCIGCHMSRPNKNGNHLFLPVSRSTTTYGDVTGIASEVCFNCHGPSSTVILDLVREQKAQYTGALEALNDQLATKLNVYFAHYSPYFFIAPGYDPTYDQANTASCSTPSNLPVKNWQTGGSSTFTLSGAAGTYSCTSAVNVAGTPGTGQNNMGAAFNLNLLEHDPGAYVHNRMYAKRLIYDSIDWADDGAMNYSVGATLNALCTSGTPPAYCAEATTYLLPNGVLWNGAYPAGNGIAAERP
jgi:hypothetical protein